MQGRASLLAKVATICLFAWVLTGCEQPNRIKSMESVQAATLTNPQRDFKQAPLDPYSYGGIAMATGGRDTKASYGALAPGEHEGETQIYRDLTPAEQSQRQKDDNARIYGVPDPRNEKTVSQFLGSQYVGNDPNQVLGQPGMQATPVTRVGE
jgi:hypothetical protein